MDLVISSIKERFDQPGFRTYRNLQELLIKAEYFEQEYSFVCSFYGSDINSTRLRIQLELLGSHFSESSVSTIDLQLILAYLKSLQHHEHFSEVIVIMTLILVVPATNASSERSFSSLRRIKSYLRSTMTQPRLNHLMILHAHRERTDSLCLRDVASDFIVGHKTRLSHFGKFD